MKKQYISRKGNFDSGHRVMNERMKCFNIHGHTYLYELTFEFNEMEEIGYAIDFKEIKRVGCQWIDDLLDHGMILNPKDELLIKTTKEYGTKLWEMSLNGKGEYCNPSVENIAKEIFLAMMVLFQPYPALKIHKVTIYETPNCWTECIKESISDDEAKNWLLTNYESVLKYTQDKGVIEYDDRKVKQNEN
jgi:6-pyruvoyltetrahydropterin/6-carboxytetrahydropterin synthase